MWDWGAQHRPKEGTRYVGGVGFYWATYEMWAKALGVFSRWPRAYEAPRLVQIAVAEYGYEHGGYWGCLH